jgi:hypothetical protein
MYGGVAGRWAVLLSTESVTGSDTDSVESVSKSVPVADDKVVETIGEAPVVARRQEDTTNVWIVALIVLIVALLVHNAIMLRRLQKLLM